MPPVPDKTPHRPADPTADPARVARSHRRRYALALGLIAVLTVAGHLGMRHALAENRTDGRVINVAGRQRMLSQRVAKSAAVAAAGFGTDAGRRAAAELATAASQWERAHGALLDGDAEMGLPPTVDPRTRAMLAGLGPTLEAMTAAADSIAAAYALDAPAGLDAAAGVVAGRESGYLPTMHEVVRRYEEQATARVASAERMTLVMGLVTLAVLALEALVIFRPLVVRLRRLLENERAVAEDALDLARARALNTREVERAHAARKAAEWERDRLAEELAACRPCRPRRAA